MKPVPLLLFLPLLFPVSALAAKPLTKPEIRADGRYEFQDHGRTLKFRIANDELQQSGNAGIKRISISAKDHLRKIQDEAKALSGGDRKLDLIAYPEDKPQTEPNRRVVTNKVSITLNEGMDPTTIGLAIQATGMRALEYAPQDYILEFPDAIGAITAAEALSKVPGVTRAEVMLGSRKYLAAIPNDPLFPPDTGGLPGEKFVYALQDDFSEKKTTAGPVILVAQGATSAFQWYLNKVRSVKSGQTPFVYLANIAIKDLPSLIDPLKYMDKSGDALYPYQTLRAGLPNPRLTRKNGEGTFPLYFDAANDINVITAWDLFTNPPPPAPGTPPTPASPIDGTGVKVTMIDDGVQMNHPEFNPINKNLADSRNYLEGIQTNINPNTDPTPPVNSGNNHGTASAGLILAQRDNNRGMSGIAPDAKVSGIRIIGGSVDDATFADAMSYGSRKDAVPTSVSDPFGIEASKEWRTGSVRFDVANNGWVFFNGGTDLTNGGTYLRKAMAYGVTSGRAGRGVIYVFPAGNDGEAHGNTNYTSNTNSVYGIVVGSVSDISRRVAYSNPGASLHLVTPSSGGEMAPRILPATGTTLIPANPPVLPPLTVQGAIARSLGWTLTQDEWDNTASNLRNSQRVITLDAATSATTAAGYNSNFGGTSASCAMVSGAVALMLEANPNLGFRDVQEILMRSAVVIDPVMGEWQYNSLGMPMSHKYGAGLLDCERAVRMAKVWKNLGVRAAGPPSAGGPDGTKSIYYKEVRPVFASVSPPNGTIPDSKTSPLVLQVSPPPAALRVEHVVVRLKIKHKRRGDLGVILTSSASGQADRDVESYLLVPHREDFNENIGLIEDADKGKEGEFYEFMSLRHWGTSGQNCPLTSGASSGGGIWSLIIWDNTTKGAVTTTANPNATNPEDRVYCPKANPTEAGSILSVQVGYHGSYQPSENEPPYITTNAYAAKTNSSFRATVRASSDSTVYDYRVRVVQTLSAGAPDLIIAPSTEAEYLSLKPEAAPSPDKYDAHLWFDRKTGVLTNNPYPLSSAPFKALPKGSWQLELFATSVLGTTRRIVEFNVTDPLTYAQWLIENFTVAERANPAISGPNADPDGDGVQNLMEYTMAGKPKVNEPFLLPKQKIVGNNMEYTYQADGSAQVYKLVPQASNVRIGEETDLFTWDNLTDPDLFIVGPPPANEIIPMARIESQEGTLQFWKVTIPLAVDNKVFFRLKVPEPPRP